MDSRVALSLGLWGRKTVYLKRRVEDRDRRSFLPRIRVRWGRGMILALHSATARIGCCRFILRSLFTKRCRIHQKSFSNLGFWLGPLASSFVYSCRQVFSKSQSLECQDSFNSALAFSLVRRKSRDEGYIH